MFGGVPAPPNGGGAARQAAAQGEPDGRFAGWMDLVFTFFYKEETQ